MGCIVVVSEVADGVTIVFLQLALVSCDVEERGRGAATVAPGVAHVVELELFLIQVEVGEEHGVVVDQHLWRDVRVVHEVH